MSMARRTSTWVGLLAMAGGGLVAGSASSLPAWATPPGDSGRALAVIAAIPVGDTPAQVAMSRDDTLYVTNLGSGTVSVIPPGSLAASAAITVGPAPVGIAVGADDTVAVTDISDTSVYVIDLAASAIAYTIPVGGYPETISIGNDGAIYTPNVNDATLTVIDDGSLAVDDTIPVGYYPKGVAVSLEDTVYVANRNSNTVSMINPGSGQEDDSVSVSGSPTGVAVGPDDTVYVTNFNGGTLAILDPASFSVARTIPVGSWPSGVAVTIDDTVYVANFGSHSISVVNGREGTLDDTIALDAASQSVAVSSTGLVFAEQQSIDAVAVIAPVAPVMSVGTGPAGTVETITLGAIPVGYLADDSTVQAVTFGGVTATGWAHIPGTNSWAGPVPAGVGAVDVKVAFHGGQSATAGYFAYPSAPDAATASAPRDVAAIAGVASATVTWAPPSSPGSFPVTNYRVVATPGGQNCVSRAPVCEVMGLSPGTTYAFGVQALTGAGWGEVSSPSNSVMPIAPTIVISGTRAHGTNSRVVMVRGEATGLVHVTARVRVAGQDSYRHGATKTVTSDGTFAWSRQTSRKIHVYFDGNGARSNLVTIPAR